MSLSEKAMGVQDHDTFRIALYYCYVPIQNVADHIQFHKNLCSERALTGRIRVASEGINGVLSGRLESLQEYDALLKEHLVAIADAPFDFDVKYCHLRKDLDIVAQLFQGLLIQKTKQVISLVDLPEQDAVTTKASSQRRQRKRGDNLGFVESVWQTTQERRIQSPNGVAAVHLSPTEWNSRLQQVTENDNAVLLDCRNFYESNVGHFVSPNVTTLLTNTRKFQELPQTLVQEKLRLASSKKIFMYCTGGVRCESASAFLTTLLENEGPTKAEVFQLHGGIQKYLEESAQADNDCFYRGKNFVFDQRRIDPIHSCSDMVGRCLLCSAPHDDYDNGHAPVEGKETRCNTCRILILVCNTCRPTVACWGDDSSQKDLLHCGGPVCLHKPEPQEIRHE
jgi:predicted sulfurtransferase